jgi:hypothetical protein
VKNKSWRRFLRGASLQRDFEELRDLAIRYVKEETIKPLKDLGRFVLWGTIGSVFVGFGAVLLLLGSLRYLQWQFPGPRRIPLVAALRHRRGALPRRHGPDRLAHRERHGQTSLESHQVTERSATRDVNWRPPCAPCCPNKASDR